jgi:hypothetical protein
VKPWKDAEAEKGNPGEERYDEEWKMRASYRQAYRQLGLSSSRRWNSKQFLSLSLSSSLSRSLYLSPSLVFSLLLSLCSCSIFLNLSHDNIRFSVIHII